MTEKHIPKALMYDGLELGKFEKTPQQLILHLNRDININWLPYIFVLGYNKGTDMNKIIKAWKKDRVFPKNRYGSFKMLLQLHMFTYDVDKIAEKTRCSLLTDPYWLVYNDTDTYTNCTARGKIGGDYYPYNSLQLENEENYIWRI